MSIASLFRHVDIDVPRYVAVNGTVVENVTDQAADRAEALCGELQQLLVGLGIMPAVPKLRRRHWLLAAGALAGLAAAVVTVTVTRENRLAS